MFSESNVLLGKFRRFKNLKFLNVLNLFHLKKAKSSLKNGQINYYQDCAENCEPSSSSSYNITCCRKNNCNNVMIAPKVTSCYVGGTFKDVVTGETRSQQIIKALCVSPKNQVCASSKGSYANTTIDLYYCTDSCVEGIDNITGIFTTCCQKDLCNLNSGEQKNNFFKLNSLFLISFYISINHYFNVK